MKFQCFLDTEGYQVCFEITEVKNDKKYVDAVIEFQSNPQLDEVRIKSVATFLALRDFQLLAEYFQQHIADLKIDPDRDSHTFVPMELGFQIQALSGEVRSENDGEFSLLFLVNVGKSNEDAGNAYMGGQSVVTLLQIKSFISSVNTALEKLSASQLTEKLSLIKS